MDVLRLAAAVEHGLTMKAVVLARGLGTRMRDASTSLPVEQAAVAETGVKGLIPVAGKPFLDYALSALADAGFCDVCLVIGPEHRAVRERYERSARPRRLRISFAIQARPLGTADAALLSIDRVFYTTYQSRGTRGSSSSIC